MEHGVVSQPAADVLQAYVAARLEELKRLEPAVRAAEADATHRFRVAVRRLFSLLTTHRKSFAEDSTEELREELRWIAHEMGTPRDLEVIGEELHDAPSEVVAALHADQDAALVEALESLDSDRYGSLISSLEALAECPPWSDRATKSAKKVLRSGVRRALRRFEVAVGEVEQGPAETRDERLHAVRKKAKRVRYAAELAEPVLGKEAARIIKQMIGIQEVLGAHHDAVVARQRLLASDEPAGEVVERLIEEAGAAEMEYERLLKLMRDEASTRPAGWGRAARSG